MTNTINPEQTGSETLQLDYEAYQLQLGFAFNLNKLWALKLDIPFIHRGGGVLDNTIDAWHRAFSLPRGDRQFSIDDQFQISYTDQSILQADIKSSTDGLGDIQLGLGYRIYRSKDVSLAGWLIADLPAGSQQKLTGNDKLDISLLLAASKQVGSRGALFSNFGLLLPGKARLGSVPVEQQIWFGHAGVEWSVYESLDIKLQVNAHSRFYQGSDIRMFGSSSLLIFGGTLHLKCSELDLAVSEDIKVDASPDVSFLLSWRTKTARCGN